MVTVQLPDDIQRLIEREIAAGHAVSAAAFGEEAVLRLADDFRADDDALLQMVEAGIADIEAGRYTTIATPKAGQAMLEEMMAEAILPASNRS
jgi:Arc/MetJ-type ribon-helix-helix transcriptional regulator